MASAVGVFLLVTAGRIQVETSAGTGGDKPVRATFHYFGKRQRFQIFSKIINALFPPMRFAGGMKWRGEPLRYSFRLATLAGLVF